jgi:2,3-bisphosphoglycerate-dependent phosphoglycerate mutase
MKKIFITALLLIIYATGFCQNNLITTFILIRHAEKDLTQSTSDPDLSAEGKARATKLVTMLKQTPVDAIYSTEYKRTRNTVEPLAAARSLLVMSYSPMIKEDIDIMLTKHKGGTVVVCGHSNTVPQFINYLIGEEKYKPMGDGDYGDIIVVSVTERSKNAKVVWLKY